VPATRTPLPAPHKLAPRSYRCVFLGYSSDHKGYRCLNFTMNRLLISRHVVFDESSFPFASSDPPPDDLDSLFSSSPAVCPVAPPYPSSIAGTSKSVAASHVASAPQPAPREATTPPLAPRATSASPSHPWCTSDYIRPPRQSPLALGRRSTTLSPWLVTPATRT
jgi:hypothetical protein